MNLQQRVDLFIKAGTSWVASQRECHRAQAIPLPVEVGAALGPYFSAGLLESIRIRAVPEVPNPEFYSELQRLGEPIPLDFRGMAAITFVDTILVATERANMSSGKVPALMFHESVHVCQYAVLGLASFMEQYVYGWALNGFSYAAIPLEVQAYQLQHRFEHTSTPFSVETCVQSQLAAAT